MPHVFWAMFAFLAAEFAVSDDLNAAATAEPIAVNIAPGPALAAAGEVAGPVADGRRRRGRLKGYARSEATTLKIRHTKQVAQAKKLKTRGMKLLVASTGDDVRVATSRSFAAMGKRKRGNHRGAEVTACIGGTIFNQTKDVNRSKKTTCNAGSVEPPSGH